VFAKAVAAGAVVRAVPAPAAVGRPRRFFDQMVAYAQSLGAPGLGYIQYGDGEPKGPVAKFLDPERLARIKVASGLADGDAVFFVCDNAKEAERLSGLIRTRLGEELDLIAPDCYRFAWVVDFPMFEWDDESKSVTFSHNPFSMPQGGLEALASKDPLEIAAYQYDIVCNGTELSSGAIRNHRPDIMVKAFAIAGYGQDEVEARFGGMFRAFHYGAPPHGGLAPGIDRIVMLLARTPNLREITAFPLNQQAQELVLGAPGTVDDRQLRELNIQLSLAARERLREEQEGQPGPSEASNGAR
jgi:aspartyl-tRNA synthetase